MKIHHTIVYESTHNKIILRISDDGLNSSRVTFAYVGIDSEHGVYWRCEVCGEVVSMRAEVVYQSPKGIIDYQGGDTTPFATHAEGHYEATMVRRRAEPLTWMHQRKGVLTGEIVWESDEWADIKLSEDAARYDKGEIVRVRKSFLVERAR